MTELLTAAQMREIEQAAIASGEVTGLELMEHAGRGVVEAIFEEWPELAKTSHKAVVLCGPGNNGGDGFVVARLLKEWGWEVEVFLYGDPEKLPPDAKVNCARWLEMGEVGTFEEAPKYTHEADIFVDGLFGTGLQRPLEGAVFDWAADRTADPYVAARTVAIDIPSGLCSDSGRELNLSTETVLAGLTVSFHTPKLGHYLAWGSFKSGKTVVADIGLRHIVTSETAVLNEMRDGGILGKATLAHKYSEGHALILSGGSGKTGAARMAARGALRIGAGLVTVGSPPEALQENASHLTAIMLKLIADAEGLAEVLEDKRLNALCLGPGLGTGEAQAALVATALKPNPPGRERSGMRPTRPQGRAHSAPTPGPDASLPLRSIVLDADALTLIAGDATLFSALHDQCVLTPHAGEFARLFPDIAEKLNAPATKGPAYSKVDATREAAKRAGCVVLFKGPDTVIADPSGRCSINSAHYERAAPWLATAGSGDVLAGFITGLLARGFAPMEAAETAAWLHVECARSFGPGLIAEDLPEELPKVFRALEIDKT
ncbi:NAD(P)H-hydrate epimerase [Pseudohalocynthiibacter aestuariivivens]|jgi:ADP-dependent NAD(P)H-hydrate dehydratase / NAD(P)H-hydrate epimerase|uniref:Bifunctional NAD(P)H-hydrate repair enzyme n=1 Tax=Pseudohalocynthiibacter aestuariivivens TaxID=1591409 RepID=A0ABV5JDF0_9RHOB|nr:MULTISPECIES: NAD(P)H-hydrate epimerase [Pseudohalocynthiibacter]MBS9718597.1 NAD(P)H-hydrate epimerase [Pseudohalocynthiibacter aestuariivivens]MCK0103609.1 NAD(P)H-hydrate epimerase [Pseudohalocynthiibacter sp. F2068]